MSSPNLEAPAATGKPSPGGEGFGPSIPWVAPFAVFLFFLAVSDWLSPLGRWESVLRFVVLSAVLWFCSRHVIELKPRQALPSVLLGAAVFFLWIGPDVLFGPGYRQHWLFSNSLTGKVSTSIPEGLLRDPLVLLFRSLRAVLLVPIIEELFWRGWLMRWLIRSDFRSVPLGTWSASAFWIVAVLFASEHGPWWDVGLLTGVIYGWWMIRTRSLADCILAHAVTNALLCAYVVLYGKWEYWL